MKRLANLSCMLALAGCAASPPAPPGTVVPAERLAQAVQPGVTTKAMLLAQFGATSSFRFDSGRRVRRRHRPARRGQQDAQRTGALPGAAEKIVETAAPRRCRTAIGQAGSTWVRIRYSFMRKTLS
jgi:hypothetical protein